MINIQFMDESNVHITKRNEKVYIPNVDKMIENACCQEEIDMLLDYKKRVEEKPDWYGFRFKVVYTDFYDGSDFINGKQVFRKKWQIMQHPWYIDEDVEVPKAEVMQDIAYGYMNFSYPSAKDFINYANEKDGVTCWFKHSRLGSMFNKMLKDWRIK